MINSEYSIKRGGSNKMSDISEADVLLRTELLRVLFLVLLKWELSDSFSGFSYSL